MCTKKFDKYKFSFIVEWVGKAQLFDKAKF